MAKFVEIGVAAEADRYKAKPEVRYVDVTKKLSELAEAGINPPAEPRELLVFMQPFAPEGHVVMEVRTGIRLIPTGPIEINPPVQPDNDPELHELHDVWKGHGKGGN